MSQVPDSTGSLPSGSAPESPAPAAAPVPPLEPSSPVAATTDPGATGTIAAQPGAAADQLPEWEELTPELVEDEAIRGDIMLRGAVILLGVLLACTQILDTSILVQVKSGQYQLAHGFIPPRQDVLTTGAAQHIHRNMHWMADNVLAVVHRMGGEKGLSIWSALLGGIAAGCLVKCSRPQISTWWTSICVAAATVAAFPLLTPGSEGLTLVGAAVVMYLLNRWAWAETAYVPWTLVAVQFVWAQADPRAYIGMILILGFAAGFNWLRSELPNDAVQMRKPPLLWTGAVTAVAVCILNPTLWNIYLAPYSLVSIDYPERLDYGWPAAAPWLYSVLTDSASWTRLDHHAYAGLGLFLAAVMAQVLNWRNLCWEWLPGFVGVACLAGINAHELPVLAFVSAVVASLNGQAWYRSKFQMEYTTNGWEVFYSRAGRAVTVLGIFGIAYLAVSGRLMGPAGRRVGLGLHPELAATIDGYRRLLTDDLPDDRPFNFRPEQGDVLIWLGRKPFMDSRFLLHGSAPDQVTEAHKRLREAVLPPTPGRPDRGKPELWKQAFDRLEITHIVPRLSADRPELYVNFLALLGGSGQPWRLTALGGPAAVLVRPDSTEPAVLKYIQDHPVADFVSQAFREAAPDSLQVLGPRPWPQPSSSYTDKLLLPAPRPSGLVHLAAHYHFLHEVQPLQHPTQLAQFLALELLSFRTARSALIEDPQSVDAYRAAAIAAQSLAQLHSQIMALAGQNYQELYWAAQAQNHWQQVLRLSPSDEQAHRSLYQLALLTNKTDVAHFHLRALREIADRISSPTKEQKEVIEAQHQQLARLNEVISEVKSQIREKFGTAEQRPQAITEAYRNGCPLFALELVNEDATIVTQTPELQLIHANLLMDAGRLEDAAFQLEGMEASFPPETPPQLLLLHNDWRTLSGMMQIAVADEHLAIRRWGAASEAVARQSATSMLEQLPGRRLPPIMLDLRAASFSAIAIDSAFRFPQQWSTTEYLQLCAELSQWKNEAAAARVTRLLESAPESPLRPLLVVYLQLLNRRSTDLLPPSQTVPLWDGMFAEDAAPDATPAASE